MTYQFKSIRSAGGESTFALGGILPLELVCRVLSLVLQDLDLLGNDCCVGAHPGSQAGGLEEGGGAQPGSHAGGLEKTGVGRMNLCCVDW